MEKIIKVLSGNPGVGKTKQFIEGIDQSKRYVYASPTRKLAQEVMQRLDEVGQSYLPIFTSQTNEVGSVIHQANKSLAAKDSTILIITHKCLASLKPELLKGWELVVDEAPTVDDIKAVEVLAKEYETVIAPYVGDCDDNGGLIINMARLAEAYEIHAQGMDDAKNKRMQNKTLHMVLDAMLSPTKTAITTTRKNAKGKDVVLIQVEGYTDFTIHFGYASSVTLMGAHIEHSLLVKHAEKVGFRLHVDRQRVAKDGLPIIFPLIKDSEGSYVSKRQLLTMPDGSVATEWNAQCFGQHVLNKALQMVGDTPAIFASHEWCKPDLPENVVETPFDVRGLNKWRDKTVSIHMLHGNPSPHELGPAKRIIEKMGLDLEEGRQALRWAREDDNVLQFAHRTKVRDEDFEGHTWHIVTSDTQAKKLAHAFDGSCIIDRRLMHYPPDRMPSEDQAKRKGERDDLASQARTLKDAGMSIRDIAENLSISKSKADRLIKNCPKTY